MSSTWKSGKSTQRVNSNSNPDPDQTGKKPSEETGSFYSYYMYYITNSITFIYTIRYIRTNLNVCFLKTFQHWSFWRDLDTPDRAVGFIFFYILNRKLNIVCVILFLGEGVRKLRRSCMMWVRGEKVGPCAPNIRNF